MQLQLIVVIVVSIGGDRCSGGGASGKHRRRWRDGGIGVSTSSNIDQLMVI